MKVLGGGNCVDAYPRVKLLKYTYTLIDLEIFPQKFERVGYFNLADFRMIFISMQILMFLTIEP